MQNKLLLSLLVSLSIFLTGTVNAEDITKSVIREGAKGAFQEFERQMINKYFSDYVRHKEVDEDEGHSYKSKKKKKSKKKGLPPGIAKKLERGGTLPPGIAKRYLPDDLRQNLPNHLRVMNTLLLVVT